MKVELGIIKEIQTDCLNQPGSKYIFNLSVESQLWPWNEVSVLPTKEVRKGFAMVEIAGLQHTGKSTTTNALIELPASYHRQIYPEDLIIKDGRETNIKSGLERLWPCGPGFVNINFERIKHVRFDQTLEWGFKTRQKDPTRKIEAIIERGPNDSLAFLVWAYINENVKLNYGPTFFSDIAQGIKVDTQTYTFPGWKEQISELISDAYFEHMRWVDAVVLFGSSYEVAKNRRLSMGLNETGKVFNPKNHHILSLAYGWWLASVYPKLYSNFGTGLLVVNGEKSSERNIRRVNNYCDQVAQIRGL